MAVQSSWIKNTDNTSPWDINNSPNSCLLEYPANSNLIDIIDTVESFITAHGWTLIDVGAITTGVNAIGCTQLSTWSNITGVTQTNTDGGKLYYNLTNSGSIRTLSVYKDSAKTQLVLEGSRTGDGVITLSPMNGSGLGLACTVTYTADDTDSGNIIHTNGRAYKALNLDGSTYKYVMLDYSNSIYLRIKVYESWNEVTHTGTNECYSWSSDNYQQRLDITKLGQLYIFCHARWLIINSYCPSTGALGSYTGATFTGCFEITRDNPEDTPAIGVPPYGLTNGYKLTNDSSNSFQVPRLKGGSTGTNAQFTISCLFGISLNSGLTNCLPTGVNTWNGKLFTMVMKLFTSGEIKGRIFGLKVLGKSLSNTFLDLIPIKCDSNFFPNNNGTTVTHHILVSGSNNEVRLAIPR